MSETLVNKLDKLVEDSNIYNKGQSKTQKELNEEYIPKVNNNSENIDYIVPKNKSISDGSVNFIDDAIDYKIFEIEIEGNSSQNGIPTIDSPVEKNLVKGEILLSKSGAQLFDINTITLQYYMNTDGTLTRNVNAFYSDFIPAFPSTTIKITNASYDTRVIEFDENKEYITGAKYTTGTIRTIQLNDNTHYIVVSDNKINDKYKEMVVCAEYMNSIDNIYTGNTINKISLGNNQINKLSTYDKDIIKVDKKGKVVFNKNIERLVITGNENIKMAQQTYTNPDGSINHLFTVPVPSNRRVRTQHYVESNFGYFQHELHPERYNNNVSEFNEVFDITTNQYQTLEEFVAWVKEMYENGTPLYIDYMITPIQIDLGNIEKLSTTEGYNYVKTATNIETNTNVKYALDIKRYADNQIDELKAMVLENS